jgi:gamma-glutamyltranspeptidase/glutathione hydrolase
VTSSNPRRAAILRYAFAASAALLLDPAQSTDLAGDRYDRLSPYAAHSKRSPVISAHGAASTSQPIATQVAVSILQEGGSAVDAAIAANAVVCIAEPMNCGIGGDLFALVWDPERSRLYGLNGSGRTAKSRSLAQLRSEFGIANRLPHRGALTVTVPGAVDAWFALHERFGALPMRRILEPAISYARKGIPIGPVTSYVFHRGLRQLQDAELGTTSNNLFQIIAPEGHTPRPGQLFRNPDLADSYAKLARHGRDVFYEGELADRIVAFLSSLGSALDMNDFRSHTSEWVEPLSVKYQDYDIYQMPPNTQGVAVLEMLLLLEPFDLKALGHNSADYLHLLVEAKKLAYQDLTSFVGDSTKSRRKIRDLLQEPHLRSRRESLSRSAYSASCDHPAGLSRDDTAYVTVADSSGMMVSLIQSVYASFGSGLVPDGLGFALQNRGTSFALDERHPNSYEPGKRPFHTIIPGFVMKHGRPFLAYGLIGGTMQPQGHVQLLLNMIEFGMNIQQAGDAARVRHEAAGEDSISSSCETGTLWLETAIGDGVQEALHARGHTIGSGDVIFFGMFQGIYRDPATGLYWSAVDSRSDGAAAGY